MEIGKDNKQLETKMGRKHDQAENTWENRRASEDCRVFMTVVIGPVISPVARTFNFEINSTLNFELELVFSVHGW